MKLLSRADYDRNDSFVPGEILQKWDLLPESTAKPQPDYIPQALVADYAEACRIRDLSPKASATLARRCLQGMIRDFCKISKPTLNKEIEALRKAVEDNAAPAGVTPESVDGIDAVRKVGNIGAHMEADVNTIIDIEAGEAQILIGLVEMLFEDWYVARHKRAQRFASVKALAETKKMEIAEAKRKALPSPAAS